MVSAPSSLGERRLSVLQLDPSLFTAPYDAALSDGLEANGVDSFWPSRALRPSEEDPLGRRRIDRFFYPYTEGDRRRTGAGPGAGYRLAKGLEHAVGLARLDRLVQRQRPDLVHVQWSPLPMLDRRAIGRLRRHRPVVLTVHDIEPFNGRPVGGLQRQGYDGLLGSACHLIVHTEAGRSALQTRGIAGERISVIPHGTLPLPHAAPESRDMSRWRIVLFGRMQPYKGADLAIEALGRLDRETRDRIELVIAGEPLMDTAPLHAAARHLSLGPCLDIREGRLTDEAMAALLRSADAFVFPYRTIDASGVLHLVAPLGKWLIASDLAAFRNILGARSDAGQLVQQQNIEALAQALKASIGRTPTRAPDAGMDDWTVIGFMTRIVYEQLLHERMIGGGG